MYTDISTQPKKEGLYLCVIKSFNCFNYSVCRYSKVAKTNKYVWSNLDVVAWKDIEEYIPDTTQ